MLWQLALFYDGYHSLIPFNGSDHDSGPRYLTVWNGKSFQHWPYLAITPPPPPSIRQLNHHYHYKHLIQIIKTELEVRFLNQAFDVGYKSIRIKKFNVLNERKQKTHIFKISANALHRIICYAEAWPKSKTKRIQLKCKPSVFLKCARSWYI